MAGRHGSRFCSVFHSFLQHRCSKPYQKERKSVKLVVAGTAKTQKEYYGKSAHWVFVHYLIMIVTKYRDDCSVIYHSYSHCKILLKKFSREEINVKYIQSFVARIWKIASLVESESGHFLLPDTRSLESQVVNSFYVLCPSTTSGSEIENGNKIINYS